MHKQIKNKIKLPRHHELQDSPRRKKMTKGNLNNENLATLKPFSILGYNIFYYYFSPIGSMKSYIHGYLIEICAKILLKANTFDDMLY